MEITEEIRELAELFKSKGEKLYLVGGYVRDSLNGFVSENPDYDLCSRVTPRELIDLIEDSNFTLKNINGKVGVMAIVGKNTTYEHTTFRKDEYDGESHFPTSVRFVQTVEEDAKRRDFKVDAIYYDILEDKIIDPLGGKAEIQAKRLSTTRNPKIVYEDDPERILRAIRLSCVFGFKISEDEMDIIYQNIENIKYLSKKRIRREFEKVLNIDKDYKTINKIIITKIFETYGKMGLWKYILPSMEELLNSKIKNEKGEEYYLNIINEVRFTPQKIRLCVMLKNIVHSIYSPDKIKIDELQKITEEVVEKNLGESGLDYPVEDRKNIVNTIIGSEYRCGIIVLKSNLRTFVFNNRFAYENIISLMQYTKLSEKLEKVKNKTINLLNEEYEEMKNSKYPMYNSELNIDGWDLIHEFPKIKLEKIDDLKEAMLRRMVVQMKKNNKEDLIILASKEIDSNREFYLE